MVVVITGAGDGIGKELCKRYLKNGNQVIGVDVNEKNLQAIASENSNFLPVIANVADRKNFEAGVSDLCNKVGNPSLWFNNAGIAKIDLFSKITDQEFDQVIDVNLRGVIYGSRIAMKLMKDSKNPKIINMASMAGIIPSPNLSPYCATKHAVVGFTRSLRLECEQEKLPYKFILVAPWFAKTKILEANPQFKFPKWLEWSILDVPNLCSEIIEGINKDKAEIFPGLQGKLMRKAYQLGPGLVEYSSKFLKVQKLSDFFK